MKNKIKILARLIFVFVCLLFSVNMFSACSKDKDTTYAVSGYVFDELGNAVEGVSVYSDIVSTTTDKSGKWSVSGLDGSVLFSVEKEGYCFEVSNKMVTGATDSANFTAYQKYTLSGTAHNNEVAVPNANIVVESLAGTFFTTTNEIGEFVVDGVAGQSNISCEIDTLQFYETTASIENSEISINTTSSLTINLDEESNQIDFSQIELWVDGNRVYLASKEKVLKGVKCGTVVEIKSSYYHFDSPSKFVVDSLNQVEDFNLSKLYSITGEVKSGTTSLKGANVYVDGNLSVTVDETGFFEIPNQWGTRVVSVEYAGFDFDEKSSNYETKNFAFNGTKNILLEIDFDYDSASDLMFGGFAHEKVDSNSYKLKNVSIGDSIPVTSKSYHVSNQNVDVDFSNTYSVKCFKLFNASVEGLNGLEATILLDGEQCNENSLKNLYGTHEISASYQNFVFSKANVDAENATANLTYVEPYNVVLQIKSGDIVVSNATVEFENGTKVSTNNQGSVTLSDLVNQNTFVVSAEGFNSKQLTTSKSETIVVNLTYSVTGYVKTGDVFVNQAEVKIGEQTVTTNSNGYFEFKNCEGVSTVLANKENFVFNENQVSQNSQIEIIGTYSISGTIFSEEVPVSDFKINLRSISSAQTQTLQTVDGSFEFSGLSGRYFLYVENSFGAIDVLKPNSYNVSGAGTFNFSSSGFQVSGYVKSGNIAIENARVTAGALSTYTDSKGYYAFELLTSACTVSVQKQGYVFSSGVEVSEDAENVNFSATYSVTGLVCVGDVPLSGVSVLNGQTIVATTNENGEFSLQGLSSTQTLTFEKQGYVFDEPLQISGYGNYQLEQSSIKIKAKVVVKSANIDVSNFDYFINSNKISTSSSNEIEIESSVGDVVSFEKAGYTISSVTITEPKTYVAVATYSVSGTVVSGDVNLENFEIFVNGKKVSALIEENMFTLSLLEGENKVSVQKDGFVFAEKKISEYQTNIEFNGTYNINGFVYVGQKPLSGVLVKLNNDVVCSTNQNGQFEFKQISGKFDLTCEKQGYNFDAVSNKFGEQKITFQAKYKIAGVVKSGNLFVEDAEVCLIEANSLSNKYVSTDENGSFEFENISSTARIIVSKEGYTSAVVSDISDLKLDYQVNLKYTIVVTFSSTGVTLYLDDEKIQLKDKTTYTNNNLEGSHTLRFERENTSFTKNNIEITGPCTHTITTSVSYSASGRVTVKNSFGIPNIKVISQAGDEVVTNADGYFEFSNVSGEIYLENQNLTTEKLNVTASGSNYNFSVEHADFAYSLYTQGYANLDNAQSFQIFGEGIVTPSMGGEQSVRSVHKKDNQGNIIKNNLNYGEVVNYGVGSADPRVALVICFDASQNKWKYNKVIEGSVNQDFTASYGALQTTYSQGGQTKTFDENSSVFGAKPKEYGPYNITKTNATFSNVSVNNSGNYEFSITLSTSQSAYETQIEQLSPGASFGGFKSLVHKYTIDKNGWIVQYVSEESYSVTKTVVVTVTVDITSTITYRFKTNKSNLKIDTLDFSSSTAINNSLKESVQTEIVSNVSETYSFKNYDIVSKTIYGI